MSTYTTLRNRAMAERLEKGEAIDLRDNDRSGDYYILTKEQALGAEHGNYDFCDSRDESWIWSIGVDLKTDRVYASTTSCFYMSDDYRCIWLR